MILHIIIKRQYFGGTELGLSNYPNFNSPQEVGDAFVECGFNLVSLSNNHTLDRGSAAVEKSLEYWSKQEDVVTAGSYATSEERDEKTSLIHESNGITYSFFSYTTTTNGLVAPKGSESYVDLYSYELAKEDIEKIRENVDVIFVAMHWGNEYQFTPSSEQEEIANELAKLGVNVIIGSHPHVVQPIEFIDETLVVYSLGNFISGQNNIQNQIGLLATLTIEKEVVDDELVEIKIKDVTGDLVYTSRSNYRNYTVYPFWKLDNSILPDYENLKNKYEAYLNVKNDNRISIGMGEVYGD